MSNITAFLTTILVGILDQTTQFYNTSFGLTILHDSLEQGQISLAVGFNDRFTRTEVETGFKWPVGSVTKTITAIRALKMYEEGLLDIDSPIYRIVDPLIMRDNGTSLLGIFKDERVNSITARQIMMMSSGIPDYDDENLKQWTFEHPNEDRSPYDLLYEAGAKGLACDPGSCGVYSTTGFNLLGLVIAAAEGKNSWIDLDQSTFIPTNDQYVKDMQFPKLGPCSPYLNDGMVHQYAANRKKGILKDEVNFFDMSACSCLNAWTGGNLAAPTYSLARIIQDLMHFKLLNETTVSQMIKFKPMGYMVYGTGLMEIILGLNKNETEQSLLIGHLGMDYGSGGGMLYNKHYDLSISITTNSAMGMNCTASTFKRMTYPIFNVLCQSYRSAIKVIFGDDLDMCNNGSEDLLKVFNVHSFPKKEIECSWSDDIPSFS